MSPSFPDKPQRLVDYQQIVLDLVACIPPGRVATYKQLAQRAGLKNPRAVGRILRDNPLATALPCHRVVRSNGTFADGELFGERFGQIVLLRGEGVQVLGGRIKLSEFLYHFDG